MDLFATRVTDAGLVHLKGLHKLKTLILWGAITDAGLENLKELKQLESLGLAGTNVTREGVKRLRQALPKCEIYGRRGARLE